MPAPMKQLELPFHPMAMQAGRAGRVATRAAAGPAARPLPAPPAAALPPASIRRLPL